MPVYFHSRMAELTIKYLNDKITENEKQELKNIIDSSSEKRKLFEKLTDENYYLLEVLSLSRRDIDLSWKELKPTLDLVPEKITVWNCIGRWLRRILSYRPYIK